ncbi:MAG: type VI secretion system contractile sheath large subunit [Alphaproteobacteria bacterium]|nr:type VI secretion system contractile sheath large subunit [Alphaproteobacteria bacterium]
MTAPEDAVPADTLDAAGISLVDAGLAAAASRPPQPSTDHPAGSTPVVALTPAQREALRRRHRKITFEIDRIIAGIDAMLSVQVDEILHHPRVQRLEASWRGILWLVRLADSNKAIKIRLLNLSWRELGRDLERAIEFDQSQAFDKIYTQEFDTPGGEPYGLIVADYEPSKHPKDLETLRALAGVVAAPHAPTILGCSPSMFGVDRFRELVPTIDLSGLFQRPEFAGWRGLRTGTEDTRYLGLAFPRVLMRLPYRPDGSRADGFVYREAVHADEARHWLWGSAAYAFAAVTVRSFATYGWFGDIRGAGRDRSGGGLVDDLPLPWFTTDRPHVAPRPPLEMMLTERQERELSELGFIPLMPARLTSYVIFNSNQSVWQPTRYDKQAARANARLSSMLQQILCASRFAHYIKVIARDIIGSEMTPEICQQRLADWIYQYTMGDSNASVEMKARYPLARAQIDIRELPAKPGHYALIARLQPQFQLDEMGATFNLISTVRQQGQRAA